MSRVPIENRLAQCLEDYHRRRALREPVSAEDYRERLGDLYDEFVDLLSARSTLDGVPPEDAADKTFPRTFGDYVLLRELGGGAMGVVYEAVHRELGRKAALKVLRAGLDADPLARERFQLEARTCAHLRHENIVEIYEVGTAEGRPFYAMPILTGENLAELIRARRVPSPVDLCRGLAGIADALDALNGAGIVHRDVKPANIMVDPDGRMVLADFGLARTATSQALTQTGQAIGTPLYMSPEQVLGRKDSIDGRSDVYGLGVTLYEALSGQPPFKAEGVHNLIRLILNERPRPLGAVAPQLPREVCNIAMKAIERAPEDRYQTAAEMRLDLLNFSRGLRVAGRPVASWRVFLRDHRWRLVAAAALLLIAGAAAILWARRPGLLTIQVFPAAALEVDGVDRGGTPAKVPLRPGTHEVVLRQSGFAEKSIRLKLGAGERRLLEASLIAENPDDPESLNRLAAALGIEFPVYALKARKDVDYGPPVLGLVWPRGAVRKADLSTVRIDVPATQGAVDGTVVLRQGALDLWIATVRPQPGANLYPVPEEAVEMLKPGDVLNFSFVPAGGEPVAAECRLVGDEADRAIDEVVARLRDQPDLVRCHFRAHLLLGAGLPLAAYREAHRVLEAFEHSPRALALAQEALEALGLVGAAPWREVAEEISELTLEARRTAFHE